MFRLPNAPIVEAVLDLDCDLPPGTKLSALEPAARERFGTHYPKFRAQLLHEHLIEAKPDALPSVSLRHHVGALQFLQDDERQLVQLRQAGFSFNRLAPYTCLDDYLPEIQRTWNAFVEMAAPLQLRGVRLRYINRILLPAEEGKVRLEDYLKVAPTFPGDQVLNFVGFLNQYAALEKETGHQVNLVLTSQPLEGSALPIIFDNCVAAQAGEEVRDWDWILAKIQALRALKNRIFRNMITKKCLELFQ